MPPILHPPTSPRQLAARFILLKTCIEKIEPVEAQIGDADMHLDVIAFYDANPPSDDEEGGYDEARWERVKIELEARLERLKRERADRMLDVVRWAVKVETGKFLPAEVLAMVHGYISLDEDEEDIRDCDTDSEIYNGSGRFGIEEDDDRYESD